jgi:hypothetical protein
MNFTEWLNESVSFTVRGWESAVPKNIYYLALTIDRKLREIFGKQYETGDLSGAYEKLTIDGLEADAKEGTLNFYGGGMKPELVKKFIDAIKFYLREMNINLTGVIQTDKSNMFTKKDSREGITVYRIPVAITGREKRPPELNIANDNAAVLMQDILDIDDYQAGSISPHELLDKLRKVDSFAVDMSTQTAGWMGREKRHYYGGISEPQIRQYLDQLKQLAMWSIQNHYDVIDWQ